MTLRLYRENPLLLEFAARVMAVKELDASW